jgi:hypothetical protein
MARYIGGREVTCRLSDAAASQYHCRVGEYDLAEAVSSTAVATPRRTPPPN